MYFRKNLINATDTCKIERQINLGVFYPPWFKEDGKFQEEIASVNQAAILNRLRPALLLLGTLCEYVRSGVLSHNPQRCRLPGEL